MFEHDYLIRMFMQLFEAISRSMQRASRGEVNPEQAAQLLEDAVEHATNVDGSVLLTLTPESIAQIMEVSGTDPRVAEYVARTLYLEGEYLEQADRFDLARLRREQARALGTHYGFSLDENLGAEAAMQAFLEAQKTFLDMASGRNA